MALAIVVIAIGGLMVYSSLKGVSIADAFGGAVGDPIDPTGGVGNAAIGPGTGDSSGKTGGYTGGAKEGGFKGPNAAKLAILAQTAIDRFDLRITEICRDENANYGADDSLHKQCRAFDASGTAANMLAFARYVKESSNVAELFYDPAGFIAPGFDHTDHVHVGD